jgi:hypothetical protein
MTKFWRVIILGLCLAGIIVPNAEAGKGASREPVFLCQYLSVAVKQKITGLSYRDGCPVAYEDLRLVKIGYWDFEGLPRQGELIVHATVAREVRDIFRELYEQKFPIAKIRLIDEYGADDARSMADNNTSAFNYRKMSGGSGKLSRHSYGVAIDINPIQNPYVKNGLVDPVAGQAFVNRSQVLPGMITKDDIVYQAFSSRGWSWGGDWGSLKDYQHFEKPIPR